MNLSAQDQLSSLVRLQTWVLRVRKSRTIRQGKLEIDNGKSYMKPIEISKTIKIKSVKLRFMKVTAHIFRGIEGELELKLE